jgi:hypothetical protein
MFRVTDVSVHCRNWRGLDRNNSGSIEGSSKSVSDFNENINVLTVMLLKVYGFDMYLLNTNKIVYDRVLNSNEILFIDINYIVVLQPTYLVR